MNDELERLQAYPFQKLADRSLFLYLTDENFRKQITNQINLDLENQE